MLAGGARIQLVILPVRHTDADVFDQNTSDEPNDNRISGSHSAEALAKYPRD